MSDLKECCRNAYPGRPDTLCSLACGHDGPHQNNGDIWYPVPDESWSFMSGVARPAYPVTPGGPGGGSSPTPGPMPAYVCSEPGCEAVFADPEPDEAWGQYTEHQTTHDMDNDYITTAEVPD